MSQLFPGLRPPPRSRGQQQAGGWAEALHRQPAVLEGGTPVLNAALCQHFTAKQVPGPFCTHPKPIAPSQTTTTTTPPQAAPGEGTKWQPEQAMPKGNPDLSGVQTPVCPPALGASPGWMRRPQGEGPAGYPREAKRCRMLV